ncbi:MAG: DUF4349 domain-containing protein [Spirochaetales bacterium]|jgi:hypothetical protein|nr:DUF4349 domain-containing protein [Spirochaetales bacterium]
MNRFIFALIMIIVVIPALAAEDNTLFYDIQAVGLVADSAEAVETMAVWAESAGGYFLFKSDDSLMIRFPFSIVKEFIMLFENTAERIIELNPAARDMREEISSLETGITSRDEVLAKNLEYIDRTDVEGLLSIEKEVLRLLTEIEHLKGRLRVLEVNQRMARARVDFRIIEAQLPADIPSSFPWINSIDFYSFVEGR